MSHKYKRFRKNAKMELMPYEEEFLKSCKRNKLKVFADEDGTPILFPAGRKRREYYKIGPWGKGKCDVCITAGHAKRMNKILSSLTEGGVAFTLWQEGDFGECSALFALSDLMKVTEILHIRRHRPATAPDAVLFKKKSRLDGSSEKMLDKSSTPGVSSES